MVFGKQAERQGFRELARRRRQTWRTFRGGERW